MVSFCDNQTIKDLEFPIVLEQLYDYCVGPTAQSKSLSIQAIPDHKQLQDALFKVNEWVQIKAEGLSFPALQFEELELEIQLLPKKNASLPMESFIRIRDASDLVNRLVIFFQKHEDRFFHLRASLKDVYFTEDLIHLIDQVFDKRGQIKDDASETLFGIRQRMKTVQQQINRNFDKELKRWLRAGFLSDTKESYFDNRRMLAVLSTHKRQVAGSISGSSKTSTVTYIEPQVNVPLNFEMEQLLDDERKEIFKILQVLTANCYAYFELICGYQNSLTELDFIHAKCRLARSMNACLPAISEEQEIHLIEAYHPVLKWKNVKQQKNTFPQSVKMDKFSRMLVISGPNAGGKSITLKTIGLLQLMIQCGLLIPVHPNSRVSLFHKLLTDIGDNQSIENELSTYSYRLKRMRYFLEVANRKTLLLLDEFGTGSDPELGGALAEVFFEELYQKKSFGVITTHYSNIKLKADELRNAINGCMIFNTETLQPLYKFSMGQPGSSFTFEVATINGIPKDIIAKAKSKLDVNRVKMDRLLSELQKEKSYLSRLNKEHISAQEKAEAARVKYTTLFEQLDKKMNERRAKMEQEDKLLILGKRLKSFIDRYKTRGKGKNINSELLLDVKKYIAVEKSKIEEAKKAAKLKSVAAAKKKQKTTKQPKKDPYQQNKIVVGSQVKIIATKQKGQVENIDQDDITITFGFARLKVHRSKLMLVE